jgi:hypothetical protein
MNITCFAVENYGFLNIHGVRVNGKTFIMFTEEGKILLS